MRLGSHNRYSEALGKSRAEKEAEQSAASAQSQVDKAHNKGQVLEVLGKFILHDTPKKKI